MAVGGFLLGIGPVLPSTESSSLQMGLILPPCVYLTATTADDVPQELPLRVEYMSDVGVLQSAVLQLLGVDLAEGVSSWQLADVKANSPGKGRTLSKRQRTARLDIRLEHLERVRVHVD